MWSLLLACKLSWQGKDCFLHLQHFTQCSDSSRSIFWQHVLSSKRVLMPCLNGNIETYVLCFYPFGSYMFEEKSLKTFSLSIPEWSSWPFILGTIISRKHCYLPVCGVTFLGRNRISKLRNRNIGRKGFWFGKGAPNAL